MAKYTELLKDYLKDHELPIIFDDIKGFKELFIARYCDREIGYETEDTFEIKLQLQADLMIPEYKPLLEHNSDLLNSIIEPKRTTKSKITDLPINDTEASPTQTSEAEETGASLQDAMSRRRFLEAQRKSLMEQLLDEFNTCFMTIY